MRFKGDILNLIPIIPLTENHKFKQYKANNIRKQEVIGDSPMPT